MFSIFLKKIFRANEELYIAKILAIFRQNIFKNFFAVLIMPSAIAKKKFSGGYYFRWKMAFFDFPFFPKMLTNFTKVFQFPIIFY